MNEYQLLLSSEPLFRRADPESGTLNLLTVGEGSEAEAWMDLTLSAGQLPDISLSMTVCVRDPEAAAFGYLAARPAMADFLNVCAESRSLADPADPYGILRFVRRPAEEDWTSFAAGRERADRFHYIMITGEEPEQTAALLHQALQGQNPAPLIVFRRGGAFFAASDRPEGQLLPARNGAQAADGHLSLEEAAFNAHMLWVSSVNGDEEAERKRFFSPEGTYNRLSSQAYALSIPAKLWAAGIRETDPDRAAEEMARLLAADESRVLTDRLTAMERRRWVMEKAAAGLTGLPAGAEEPFALFVQKGSMKTEGMHLCIIRSLPGNPLEGPDFQGKHHDHWDKPGSWDLQLDDLDRQSVNLHRYFREKAAILKAEHYPDREDRPPAQLQKLLMWQKARLQLKQKQQGEEIQVNPLEVAFNRFAYCIHSVLDGSAAYARQFRTFREDFRSVFLKEDPDRAEEAEKLLQQLEHDLFPAVEAALYRNYKQNDETLIRSIPAIMTRRRGCALALPFLAASLRADVNDRIFLNLASALLIRPRAILYLYDAAPAMNPDIFAEMMSSCRRFLHRYHVDTEIHLAISLNRSLPEYKRKKWKENLQELQESGVLCSLAIRNGETPLPDCTDGGAENFFADRMQKIGCTLYDGTAALFASPMDNLGWTERMLRETGYFELNSATKFFRTTPACRWLSYQEDDTFLRIDDMFALMNGEQREYHYPDYTEPVALKTPGETEPLFLRLWRICNGEVTRMSREASVSAWDALCTAMDPGKNRGLVPGTSLFSGHVNYDTVKAYIKPKTRKNAETVLLALADMKSPSGEALLTLERNTDGSIARILTKKKNLADVLCNAGMVLEIYAFFQAFETGYFDDIACGYTFYWGDHSLAESERKNELDLVLTKGFRSILAECKGTARLDQGYFHKLSSLADLFGINAGKVLIANAYSTGENARHNENQIGRGRLMDIVTLYRKSELEHLGEHLARLLK